jgi:hypothetical protein
MIGMNYSSPLRSGRTGQSPSDTRRVRRGHAGHVGYLISTCKPRINLGSPDPPSRHNGFRGVTRGEEFQKAMVYWSQVIPDPSKETQS